MSAISNKFEKSTGSVAIAIPITVARDWILKQIVIHLNQAGGSGNLVATIDSVDGQAYDAIILTQDMTAIVNLVSFPNVILQAGDIVNIEWANAGGATYGIQWLTEEIY